MKKRTLITFFIVLLTLVTGLIGCNKNDLQGKAMKKIKLSSNSNKEEPKQQENIVLRLGYSTGENTPRGNASQKFKEIVEKETNGRIKLEIYPDGSLGSDKQLILGVINNDIDMTISSAGNFANYGKVGISAFPYVFDSSNDVWSFMETDASKKVDSELEQFNIHVLAHFDNGFRCITTSEAFGPINSLKDMQGLKIRTSDNPVVMETISELGAEPYNIDFTKLYNSLKNHEFEAEENPIPVIYNSKLYEVQKYIAITNHSYDTMPFVIRNDIWQKLSKEDKTILENAAKEAESLDRKLVKEQTENYIRLLEEKGMTITYPDLNEFKAKSAGVFDYFRNSYGDEIINTIKEWKN